MNLTKLARIPSCKLILKYINPNFRKTNTNLLIVGLTVFSSSPLSAASLRCCANGKKVRTAEDAVGTEAVIVAVAVVIAEAIARVALKVATNPTARNPMKAERKTRASFAKTKPVY